MSIATQLGSGEVFETSGRFTMFWMTRFQGFTIHSTKRVPQAGLFGAIRYRNSWRLVKAA